MKKIVIMLLISLLLVGCSNTNNNDNNEKNPNGSDKTVTYQENVVIYPPTDNNDTIISVSLVQKVQAEVSGYIVKDGKWELIFKAMSIDLNPTDYIAIKNNYSNYNTIYIGVGTNGPFDINASGQVSYKQVQHNLSLVTSTGAKVTSTHEFYENANKEHPNKGLFYFLDNYKFEIDNEQTIGFQIISDYGINNEFLSQLKYVTLDDMSKLPDSNKYNPYQLVMITLNFKLLK